MPKPDERPGGQEHVPDDFASTVLDAGNGTPVSRKKVRRLEAPPVALESGKAGDVDMVEDWQLAQTHRDGRILDESQIQHFRKLVADQIQEHQENHQDKDVEGMVRAVKALRESENYIRQLHQEDFGNKGTEYYAKKSRFLESSAFKDAENKKVALDRFEEGYWNPQTYARHQEELEEVGRQVRQALSDWKPRQGKKKPWYKFW